MDYNEHLQMCEVLLQFTVHIGIKVSKDEITPVSLAYYELYYVSELSSLI